MKKITLIAVALIAVSFASCKKAKTCSCTTTYTTTTTSGSFSSTSSSSTTDVTSYDKISSGDANVLCPKTTTDTYSSGSNTNHVDTKTCTLS